MIYQNAQRAGRKKMGHFATDKVPAARPEGAEGGIQRSLPLAGITVLDLSHVYNGPYATLLMALAGAEVIKIEPTGGQHLPSRGAARGAARALATLNSNKKSQALDPTTARGNQIAPNHAH